MNHTCYFYKRENGYSVTVAYRRLNNDWISYGAAFCHNKDQFRKSMGRAIAEGRMNLSSKSGNAISVVTAECRADVHDIILKDLRDQCTYAPNGFGY